MYLWAILDAAVVLLFIVCIRHAMKVGLINTSKNILSIILTLIIISSSHAYISSWLKTSQFGNGISKAVSSRIETKYKNDGLENLFSKKATLPPFFENLLSRTTQDIQNAQNDFVSALSKQVTDSIINILSVILLYISLRLLLWIIFKMLGLVFELPLLRSVNKLAGALIGVVNALFIIYIITAILILFVPGNIEIQDAVSQTYITKYFYENNVLLKLFI